MWNLRTLKFSRANRFFIQLYPQNLISVVRVVELLFRITNFAHIFSSLFREKYNCLKFSKLFENFGKIANMSNKFWIWKYLQNVMEMLTKMFTEKSTTLDILKSIFSCNIKNRNNSTKIFPSNFKFLHFLKNYVIQHDIWKKLTEHFHFFKKIIYWEFKIKWLF